MTADSVEATLSVLPNETTQFFWNRHERRKWFILLIFGTSMIYATRSTLPLTMPVVSVEKSWTKTDTGVILSSFFWGYTMTQVASGYASDQIGGQKIMFLSAIGWAVTTFALPDIINAFDDVDYSVPFVATVRAVNGAFQGMHYPSMISLTSQRLQENERAPFFSLLTSGSALGMLLNNLLGSFMLETYSWPLVFQLLGGVSLLYAVVLYYQSQTIRNGRNRRKNNEGQGLPWRQLCAAPSFWACVMTHACQNNCFFVLLSWMPMYFHDTFPEAKGWIVNMVPWLSLLPCTFLGKIISERLISSGYSITATRKIVESMCFVTAIINLLLLAQVQSFQGAIICLTMIIGGSGFHSNAVVVNPSDLAPRHSGSVFGMMNTVGAIPGFVGVYFAGWILHVTHSWNVVFVYIAAIDALGCAIFLAFGGGQAII